MRKIKKFAALLLALVMCMSLCIPAFAASSTDTAGRIVVNGWDGESYSIYKLFDLTYDSDDGGRYSNATDESSYSYKVVDEWRDFIEGYTIIVEDEVTYLFILDEEGYLDPYSPIFDETDSSEVMEALAKDALAYADTYGIEATSTKVASKSAGYPQPDATTGMYAGTATFSNLDLGWYLVSSSLGTICMLDSTNARITINEKNGVPIIEKYVSDSNYEENFTEKDDADNNDTLEYELIVKNVSNVKNLVVHDYMDPEQLVTDTLAVKSVILYTSSNDNTGIVLHNGETGDDYDNDHFFLGDYYTITIGECTKDNCGMDGCTFEISFSDELFDGMDDTAYLVIIYDVQLNEDFDNFENLVDEIDNYAAVSFGLQSYSTPAETETYSYGFDIYKYTVKENVDAATITMGSVQNFVNYVNVYTGSMGGVNSITLDPGTYVFTGFENWRDFANYDEFVLLEVTGSEPTADIKTGDPNTLGEDAYTPNETDGGYYIVKDDNGDYVYDIITKDTDGNWVVTVETAGTYVIAGYMYDPVYHGDVGGKNYADWEYSTAIFYCVNTNKEISAITIDANGSYIVTETGSGESYPIKSTSVNVDSAVSGAEFVLQNSSEKYAYFVKEEGTNYYLFQGWIDSLDGVPEDKYNESGELVYSYTVTLTSADDGMIYVEGLHDGTFTLTETAAPDGYNILGSSITVTIDEGGAVYVNGDETYKKTINVLNNYGMELPGTGGIGTTIFYIVGIIIVAGAAILLVVRRRMRRAA